MSEINYNEASVDGDGTSKALANRVLVVFAHPSLHRSKVNKRMFKAIKDIEGVFVDDLYQRYPDFYIDVKTEQQLLNQAELLVFHFPFYWYSSPALIKEWQDVVLERGYAYGTNGTALKDKKFLLVLSTGGVAQAYSANGSNRFEMSEFLRPFEQMAALCGLHYCPPFIVHNCYHIQRQQVEAHAKAYAQLLRNYLLNGDEVFQQPYFAGVE